MKPAGESLRLVFAGTPEFAARHLRSLIGSEHELVAVYTQPDRAAGRGKKLTASPVKALALAAGLRVCQPASLKEPQAQAELRSLQADLMVVVAYGLILPQAVLDIPRLACINVHASVLPRWRGAAPIQRAIEAGDESSGITIMQMDAGLDTGAVLARSSLAFDSDTSAGQLQDRLAELGAPLLLEVLADLPARLAAAAAQNDSAATYAHKLGKAEAQLDWQRSATDLQRQIRAFNPFPGCWTSVNGERFKIWQAQVLPNQGNAGEVFAAGAAGISVYCGTGALCLTEVQLPGGRAMASAELLHSRRELVPIGLVMGK